MTQQEFSQWVKYHGTVLPSFGDWLRKLPPLERQDMLAAWYDSTTLSLVSLPAAREGSKRLLAGKRPFHFDEQPGEVARLANEWQAEQLRAEQPTTRGPQFTPEGDRMYRCRYCRDARGGWVHVVRPELVAWFERTYESPPFPSSWRREWLQEHPRPPLDGTLLCPCRHPGKREVHYERDNLTVPVFNQELDCLWSFPVEEAVADFLGRRIPVFPEGFFSQ